MSRPSPAPWIEGLNPEQASAVAADPDGSLLILAGAGSGKTTVLTRRVSYLSHPGFAGEGILALTFTKDAAREMQARLAAREGQAADPAPWIGTFHAFAFHLIRSECAGLPNWRRLGFARRPDVLDEVGRKEWIRAALEAERAVQGTGAQGRGATETADRIEGWLAAPFADSPEADSGGCLWRARFREHLYTTGLLAFDDMTLLAARLLRDHPQTLAECRDRFPRILVDEFQDTSRDQLELVRLLAGDRPRLFLVGDDDQAIYGFRGADPGNLAAALECFPGLKVIKLETNYRSSPPIVEFANGVFRGKPAALRKRLRAGSARGLAPVRTLVHRDGAEQARWMIVEMERLRAEEGLAWNDMAVLFRLNALEPYYRTMLERMAGPDAARDVVLATVHASKGLEYPAVFFAGLEDGILPYRRGGAPLARESLDEERRIFYVGVTRAQRFLYLCACRRRVLRGKPIAADPSPFLRRAPGWLPGKVARAWEERGLRGAKP